MKLLLVGFLVVFSGCVSTTRIYSKPAGAKLVIDDEKVLGRTPVEYKESVWIWTKHEIDVTLDGYEPATLTLKNRGMNSAGFAACACTLGVLLPFMFLSRYEPQYVLELKPKTESTRSTPPQFSRKLNFK